MIAARPGDGMMKIKIRSYGFPSVSEPFTEGVQGSPHFREMLIRTPERGQCCCFSLETNPEFQHCQYIAESCYRSCLEAEILPAKMVQNKRSDAVPRRHQSGGL